MTFTEGVERFGYVTACKKTMCSAHAEVLDQICANSNQCAQPHPCGTDRTALPTLTEQNQRRDDESRHKEDREEETSTLVNIIRIEKVFVVLRKCRVFSVPESDPKKIP